MADLKLYNTLTRSKEAFQPIDAKNVRMYVCGPTVYDFAHIGNARPVIVFDVLFRLLRHIYGADHVTYARNITDVDDKINKRAFERWDHKSSLTKAIRDLTDGTLEQFHKDVDALGCLRPSHEPRATDYVCDGDKTLDMVRVIEKLIANGNAYAAEGHVLFNVPSMEGYGALARRPKDDMIAGARVEVAPYKRDPMDFVLWKPSDPATEPGWDSPWGYGRPGWHIECSAMSGALLGEVFDIHAGGLDLIFPHHENEIAQSCCAFGSPGKPNPLMARYWLHNGFLQVEGQKMSKSLGNFVTINELLATEKFGGRNWIGPILRLAMMKTHYRQPIDWTVRGLEEAQNEFRSFAELAPKFAANPIVDDEFVACLCDDLNTSDALTRLRQLRDEASKGNIDSGRAMLGSLRLIGLFDYHFSLKLSVSGHDGTPENFLIEALKQLSDSFAVSLLAESMEKRFGPDSRLILALKKFVPETVVAYLRERKLDLDALLKLDEARLAARAAKDWAESDRIRDELAAKGIQIKDGKDASGNPITTWEVKR